MGAIEAHDEDLLSSYEGLVFSTARRYVGLVDEGLEDIQQILRIKVYKAVLSFDRSKAKVQIDGSELDRYVFQCVRNQAKDLLKKRPRNESFIEDVSSDDGQAHDWFETATGMASTHDEIYGSIEEEDVVVPNTLDPLERRVLCLLYAGYRQTEVARSLGIVKRDVDRSVRSIRAKMEDWRPTGCDFDPLDVPTPGAPAPLAVAA